MLSLKSVYRWLRRGVERRFPVWAAKQRLARAWRPYEAEYEEAKRQRNEAALETIQFVMSEYSDELYSLQTKKLLRKAFGLMVRTDDITNDPDNWVIGDFGDRYLLGIAENELGQRVRKASRENFEYWVKVIAPILGAITGLIGGITGLVAVIGRK
jgi:hypothetical protein